MMTPQRIWAFGRSWRRSPTWRPL